MFGAPSLEVAGTRRVPPSGVVVAAACTVDPQALQAGVKLRGDFSVFLDDKDDDILKMSYTGVIAPSRAAQASSSKRLSLLDPMRTESVFVATLQECAVPELRWLTRMQLFGIGRVSPVTTESRSATSSRTTFTSTKGDSRPGRLPGS